MDSKICTKCQQERELTEFYPDKNNGYQAWCKDCKRDYKREYYKRPEAKETQHKLYERLRDEGYFRRYWGKQTQDPRLRVRLLARWYAQRMKRLGKIDKQPCAECGRDNSQMHHSDYDQPLLIVWLCKDCHYKLHLKVKGE